LPTAAAETTPSLRAVTDGVVTIRPPEPKDAAALIAGHDDEARRWLGRADVDPRPTACVVAGDDVVGWVDYDGDREWLLPGEVNVGYGVFPSHRGRGYATRAVQLLMHHLALHTPVHTATLLIHRDNVRSLAVASRLAFVDRGDKDDSRYFKRRLPVFPYTDGSITIRRQRAGDIDRHLEAIDDEQIDWLWDPGHREAWEAMTPAQQRTHNLNVLRQREEAFGSGPDWAFSVDVGDEQYVAYVDCDLSNPDVPAGGANVSFTCHPAFRGNGYVSRAVLLVTRFLRDNTAAREAHIVVHPDNASSLRVARAVGAVERERFVDHHGRTMIRNVIDLRSA
jgi:RimJ/RimL family protein N-acetyltransferase